MWSRFVTGWTSEKMNDEICEALQITSKSSQKLHQNAWIETVQNYI